MAAGAKTVVQFLARPRVIIGSYRRRYLRADLIAGLTVGVMLLPQGIAYAQIANLPPEYGLYTGIVGAFVGALWGSSNHLQNGPTNTVSLIVMSSMAPLAAPNTAGFLLAMGLLTVLAGILQLVMGLARLGVLANFVSHSVVVGFTTGAAVLIGVGQLEPLLGLHHESQGHNMFASLGTIVVHLDDTHLETALLGVGALAFMLVLRGVLPKLPAALLAMIGCGVAVALLGLDADGVDVVGALPQGLPPIADIPIFDVELIGKVSTAALAVAAIGITESMSIARAMAAETGQRLDPNQELVGQGLANIACGIFSGYASAGSFTRSAVNLRAGAKTQMAAIFTALTVLLAVLFFAPMVAPVPKAALAGVLIVTAVFMVDVHEIRRIWTGPHGDRLIMVATFFGTLLLPLEFAVVIGILVSFGLYIARTSAPKVHSVVPDERFERLESRPEAPCCPQLGIIDIHGDLYFGAVNQVEETLLEHLAEHSENRFLLLRMHSVNQCDFSGIHTLESVLRTLRERDGDLFMTRVQHSVMNVMETTGFYDQLGPDNYLAEERAIEHLFTRILDPAICIYECPFRVFRECQNLPKSRLAIDDHLFTAPSHEPVPEMGALELWDSLHEPAPPRVIDVREPREYQRRHIVEAELHPLSRLIDEPPPPDGRRWVLVCRGGRRSRRALQLLRSRGYENLSVLRGGMLAWRASGLFQAADPTRTYTPIRPPLAVD